MKFNFRFYVCNVKHVKASLEDQRLHLEHNLQIITKDETTVQGFTNDNKVENFLPKSYFHLILFISFPLEQLNFTLFP